MSVKQDTNINNHHACKWLSCPEWIQSTLRVHWPQSLVQQISLDRPWFLADIAQLSCVCLWHHLSHPIACPQPEKTQHQLLRGNTALQQPLSVYFKKPLNAVNHNHNFTALNVLLLLLIPSSPPGEWGHWLALNVLTVFYFLLQGFHIFALPCNILYFIILSKSCKLRSIPVQGTLNFITLNKTGDITWNS